MCDYELQENIRKHVFIRVSGERMKKDRIRKIQKMAKVTESTSSIVESCDKSANDSLVTHLVHLL
jgi:hypothetical protein